jgi:hypothetical protein
VGALIVAGLFAYLVIALVFILIPRSNRNRMIVAAIFVLVPMGDQMVGYVYLKALCAKDAGLHIYKKVDSVEGFSVDERPDVAFVESFGYRYIEGIESRGSKHRKTTYLRYQRDPETNEITRQDIQKLTSRYTVDFFHQYTKYALFGYFSYLYTESVIRDVVEDITLATQVRITYSGGWVAKYIFDEGGGGGCVGDRINVVSFVESVLKPIDKGVRGSKQ